MSQEVLGYLIVALITTVTAYTYIYAPIIEDAVDAGTDNSITNNPVLSKVLLSIISFIVAPLVLLVVANPVWREQLYYGLEMAFNKDD